jgi:hypothetical protein
VRVPADQLVVDARGHVGDREAPLLLGDRGVELDLVEQVAELLDEVLVGGRVVGIERLDGVDDLVGLLEQVGDEALMGLLDVPGHCSRNVRVSWWKRTYSAPTGAREVRDPERGEVVGGDVRSSSAQVVRVDPLVGRAESLQDRDRLVAGGAVDGELDVGQHPVGVRVGDEQRAAFAGGGGGELVAVDEPDAGLDRIDAESGPGDVEERHRRQTSHTTSSRSSR